MAHIPLDEGRLRRHQLINDLQTALLIGGSLLLLALCAYFLLGPQGMIWIVLFGAVSLFAALRVPPETALRLYRARPLTDRDVPQLYAVLRELTARADLAHVPTLCYIPSRTMNAFAVGSRDRAAIAVSDGLLHGLTLRQLAGVLAHEISHIRNGDLRVMALADVISRMTNAMAFVGIATLVFYVPVLVSDGGGVPVAGIVLLIAAPTLSGLIQLALSRTREYDADLDAVALTGDPEGLASALATLEARQGRMWENLMLPGQKIPVPSMLRTHPKTEDRIARLRDVAPAARPIAVDERRPRLPGYVYPVAKGPRWHRTGLWY